MTVLHEWLKQLPARLAAYSETPLLDAQVLLAHVCERGRAWVLAHPETQLNAEQEAVLCKAVAQLESSYPLPYVLGHWEFFGLEFAVSPAALIPRPETELLVEQALGWLNSRAWPTPPRAVDVGTGSGCIAVTLARYAPRLRLAAVDLSLPALELARQNAVRHAVLERLGWAQADLLNALAGPFDLICANPPYIPHSLLSGLAVAQHEPLLALDGGEDGLEVVRRLLAQAADRLAAPGLLLVEFEASQGAAILALGQAAFPLAHVQTLPDLAGRDRLLRVEMI